RSGRVGGARPERALDRVLRVARGRAGRRLGAVPVAGHAVTRGRPRHDGGEDRPRPPGRPFWTLARAAGPSNLAAGASNAAVPLADRLDRRRTMLVANTVRTGCLAAVALVFALDVDSLWWLYLAAVGTGVAEVFYDTASQSLLPSVVDRTVLDRANGRLYAIEMGTQQFAGPPLAGLLVAAGAVVALTTPALLWVVALALLAVLRGSFRPSRSGPRTTIRADVVEGLRFLWGRRVLRTMAMMVGVANLASSATGAILVLYAVGEGSVLELGEPGFGLLVSAIAVGALVGGLLAERIQALLGRGR